MNNMHHYERLNWYRENKGQKMSKEDFNYVDTKHIQINSLLSFMDCLGYDYWLDNTFHKRDLEGYKGCNIISLNTAVKLHNSVWLPTPKTGYLAPTFSKVWKMGGSYFETSFVTDAYILNQAKASKICNQVYFNGGKKELVCYKNAIDFVDSSYEELFLRKLIDKEDV